MLCDYGCGKEGNFRFKSGKWCCSKWSAQCSAVRKRNSESLIKSPPRHYKNFFNEKDICFWCNRTISKVNLKRHEEKCYLNPIHFNPCPICNTPTKKGQKTCSRKCRLKFFGPPNIPDDSQLTHYRTICFRHHERKCVICGEENFLDAHHYDGNTKNNDPTNFAPLCVLHHKYIHHKKLKYIVKECIDEYVAKFIKKWNFS